jgi:hypothetical protein
LDVDVVGFGQDEHHPGPLAGEPEPLGLERVAEQAVEVVDEHAVDLAGFDVLAQPVEVGPLRQLAPRLAGGREVVVDVDLGLGQVPAGA